VTVSCRTHTFHLGFALPKRHSSATITQSIHVGQFSVQPAAGHTKRCIRWWINLVFTGP
jgi:hypothetical protein